jgi:hypothetical protein
MKSSKIPCDHNVKIIYKHMKRTVFLTLLFSMALITSVQIA